MRHYILEGTTPVPVDCSTAAGLMQWGEWMNDQQRRVMFRDSIKGHLVSTVFLSIDHNYSFDENDTEPVLFETMIFKGGSSWETYMDRYCTYDQAHAGHVLACAMVRSERIPRKLKKKLQKDMWI